MQLLPFTREGVRMLGETQQFSRYLPPVGFYHKFLPNSVQFSSCTNVVLQRSEVGSVSMTTMLPSPMIGDTTAGNDLASILIKR